MKAWVVEGCGKKLSSILYLGKNIMNINQI